MFRKSEAQHSCWHGLAFCKMHPKKSMQGALARRRVYFFGSCVLLSVPCHTFVRSFRDFRYMLRPLAPKLPKALIINALQCKTKEIQGDLSKGDIPFMFISPFDEKKSPQGGNTKKVARFLAFSKNLFHLCSSSVVTEQLVIS